MSKLGIKFCSFREEKETRRFLIFNTMVVEHESAKVGDGKEEIGSIPENHRDMSKFQGSSDIGFKRVSAVLRAWIEDIKQSVECMYFAPIYIVANACLY